MYHILVGLDTVPDSVEQMASDIIQLPNSEEEIEVTILNVFEEFEFNDTDGKKISSEDLYEEGKLPESVQRLEGFLEEDGISVTTQHTHGNPSEAILETAKEVNANAIAINARKRSPVGKVLFGSVAQSILLNAECPVFVTSAHKQS